MPDHKDTLAVAARLKAASKKLHDMADDVGMATQVREFISEDRKNLLSRYMKPWLMEDMASSKAEAMARTNEDFLKEYEALKQKFQDMEQLLTRWKAENASYDAARSLLSLAKETFRQLDG